MSDLATILRYAHCPICKGSLLVFAEGARCSRCQKLYKITDGRISFLEHEGGAGKSEQPSDALIYKLKLFVKKSPRLFTLVNNILGTYVGKSARKSIAQVRKDAVIINIGAGAEIIRTDVINVDIHPYAGVHIVADIHELPFMDNTVDAVIAESVLEHLSDPTRAVTEMRRVLKPGGLVYISVPFIIGYHSSPGDYYRWTTSGLRELLKDFREEELGIAVGPTNALTYILREWLATLLSFNSSILYQCWILFFMVLFAPLNLMDHFLKYYQSASTIAHLYYFIGRK